jgi:hypothetical protein
MMNKTLFKMNGHLRPNLSEKRPKMTDPTDLNISTSVMPHVMSVLDLPNASDSSRMVRETVKKSNESQV